MNQSLLPAVRQPKEWFSMKKHFTDCVERGRCLLLAGKEDHLFACMHACGVLLGRWLETTELAKKKNRGSVLWLRKVGDSLTLNRSRIGAGCVLCQADLFIRAEWSSPIRIWRGLCTFPAFSVLWSLRSTLFFEVWGIR